MNKLYLNLLLWLLDILEINAICRMINRKKALILWYHGICDDGFSLLRGYDERHIPVSLFRKQLGYLKKRGYVFTNMSGLVTAIKKRESVKNLVVLTFDDGFKNIVENAYPIMKEYGARGCFYLISDLIGTKELIWTDYIETVIRNQKKGDFQFIFKGEKVNYALRDEKSYERAMMDIKTKLRAIPDNERIKHLEQFANIKPDNVPEEFIMSNWEQINELEPNVLEIGSHTRRHPNCANLTSDKELEDEILDSKIYIEKNTGRMIKHFCYPAGSFNDAVVARVKEYEYESAVTIVHGFNDENSDLFRLRRIETNERFLYFKSSVSGSYYMLQRIKSILRQV
jgi:peptidoglycan/xylan/chitin deacetylase (PgdA/CDA1 family)